MPNPPQQRPVKNLTQILVKYVASFLHQMAKVRHTVAFVVNHFRKGILFKFHCVLRKTSFSQQQLWMVGCDKGFQSQLKVIILFHTIHICLQSCVQCKREKNLSSGKLEACRQYFIEASDCVPANLYEPFMNVLQMLILQEKTLLNELYYETIGSMLNQFSKKLLLEKASMFQDSSMAIEAFLQHINQAPNIQHLSLAKSVIDLIDYEFEPALMTIGTFADLRILRLPGLKHIDIETDTMAEFLILLQVSLDILKQTIFIPFFPFSFQNNCALLHTLELNESTIDNECCNILGEMVSLVMLNLNHCTKLESAGVLHLIKKLDKLNRIEALRGKSSNVQNALECLENKSDEMKTVANLTHMTFRDPHGISKIAAICPNIKEVKVIYNVYEYNYDANVDNCLVSLQLFNEHTLGNLRLSADFNCLNLLFVIQWRNLKLWGPALQKLTLTEPEFLHPQTLNPFALQCDKLTDLTIINPSTISDELFVGRVPELAKNPFWNLQKLRFEGEKLPLHVAKFLLTCSTNLCEITLIIDVLLLAQFKGKFSQNIYFCMLTFYSSFQI